MAVTVTFTDRQADVVIAALNLFTTQVPEDDQVSRHELATAERAWTRINQARK